MKKILTGLIVLFTASALFAANDNSGTACNLGVSFPQIYNLNTAADNIDKESYSAFGINFGMRGTVGLPFGFYADGNVYFPYSHNITADNIAYSYSMGDGSFWGIEGQLGIYSVLLNTGRFLIPFGAGLHLNYGHSSLDKGAYDSQSTFSFGIGGFANAELTLTEKVTIYGGIRLDYDFYQRLTTETKVTTARGTGTKSLGESGLVSNLFLIPVVGLIFRF